MLSEKLLNFNQTITEHLQGKISCAFPRKTAFEWLPLTHSHTMTPFDAPGKQAS